MLTREAYAYYEAGVAVAAVHLKLKLRQVSISPAFGLTDVTLPRDGLKARITMWLAGLAAERKGVGETDAFRRMKNRQRIRAELAAHLESQRGAKSKRQKEGASLLNQAQDRANAICAGMFPAIKQVAEHLLAQEILTGAAVEHMVADFRAGRFAQNAAPAAQPLIKTSADSPAHGQPAPALASASASAPAVIGNGTAADKAE